MSDRDELIRLREALKSIEDNSDDEVARLVAYEALKTPIPNFGAPDADGWYTWDGDANVNPTGRVEVLLRSGEFNGTWEAAKYEWRHNNGGYDIVKWRPVAEVAKWANKSHGRMSINSSASCTWPRNYCRSVVRMRK